MTVPPEQQFRVEEVQIINWGGYAGLQVMRAGRASTAILGPSGGGKSTLLDVMASVIMPNPQEFNRAARDDKEGRRERTVYTYARGLTVSHQDDNGRSSTPSYLRPPGGGGFITGAAITWSTAAGRQLTAFRLTWVAGDATDVAALRDTTVYGFVHDRFDLACLHGLKPARTGGPPLSRASMQHLIDPVRGDLVEPQQARMHAAMRHALQMGRTEESQQLAMQLLRRAQASKGIFSINDLFKECVLTEPRALARWDNTVAHYREASRLYDEFELARTKADTLTDLPDVGQQYRSASQNAIRKRALARPGDDGRSGLQLWHAGELLTWARAFEEDVRLDLAQARENLQRAEAAGTEADQAEQDALTALTASGDDRTGLIRERITHAREQFAAVEENRTAMAGRLKAFGQVLPASSGDLDLLQASLASQAAELAGRLGGLEDEHERQAAERGQLAGAIQAVKTELKRVYAQAGNVPAEADQRRQRIADGTGVPASRLQYIGELLDIPPEHRGWEKAILTIIQPLASDLLVASEDFPAVRAWVNGHVLGGDVTLVAGIAHRPPRAHRPGTVAAMLDVLPGPYQGWITEELQRFTYLCVEKDTDLDGPAGDGLAGRVTRAGMRTAPNGRVVKADGPRRYRWVGRDNSSLRAELTDELEGLRLQYDDVSRRLDLAKGTVREQQAQIDELDRLQRELSWSSLDPGPATQRLTALQDELKQADNPQQKALRDAYKTAQDRLFEARAEVSQAQREADRLNHLWAATLRCQDCARDIIETRDPLTADELAAAAALTFQPPTLDADLSNRDADEKTDAAIRASLRDAAKDLDGQIEAHTGDRGACELTLLTIIRAYRNISDRTCREIDDTIDSLPALEAIHAQLVADDLPRARKDWLQKVDADLNQGLRALLQQIDVDRREITRGLEPINAVLAQVPFRQGSRLAIEPADRPASNLREFRDAVLAFTRDNPLGEDLFNDDVQVEASFRKLRDSLHRLTDPSRTGDSWRRSVFDAREHVTFRAIETPPEGRPVVHEGVSGMSGGEGQELIAFILGAALRYRLGEGGVEAPAYGCLVLDEGFVKADSDYTGRALRALQELGFQLIIAAPREKATAFEDYVDQVAYISADPDKAGGVRIYPMTIQEALQLGQDAA